MITGAGMEAVNYRERASQLRRLAQAMTIEQIRKDALLVAEEWDRLAVIAEAVPAEIGVIAP